MIHNSQSVICGHNLTQEIITLQNFLDTANEKQKNVLEVLKRNYWYGKETYFQILGLLLEQTIPVMVRK